MHDVQIRKLSKAQLSRLRNGHGCKCRMAGSGMAHDNVRMSDANIQKLIKGEGKGRDSIITLSQEEREDNKVHGTGLMSGARKALSGFAKSKAGKDLLNQGAKAATNVLKNEAKKRGVSNPLLDQVLDAGAKQAVKSATGGNLLSSAMKAGKKFAGSKAGQNLMKQGAKAGTNLLKKEAKKRGVSSPLLDQVLDAGTNEALKAANAKIAGSGRRKTKKEKVIDLIEDIAENPPRSKGESRVREAIDTVESMEGGGSFWGKKGHLFGKHSGVRKVAKALKPVASLGMDVATVLDPELAPARALVGATTGVGLYARSMGRGLTMNSMGRGLTMSSAGMQGGAIGARKGVLSVGNGGSFLYGSNPALASQPYSANFFFNTQFPPSMQEEGIFGPYSGR